MTESVDGLTPHKARMSKRSMCKLKGWHAIVVHRPKHESNIGTLWRSAFLYNTAFIGTIGRRYVKQPSDTPNTSRCIPLIHYEDIDDLVTHLPEGCQLIGVELMDGATPLGRFWHPLNALYLLGSEDQGLPQSVLEKCHWVVQIPTSQPWSMNVAVAGSIVLNHRYMQDSL